MTSINSGQSLGALGVNVEVTGVDKVTTDLKKVERSFKKTEKAVRQTKEEVKRHGAQQRKLSFVMLEASRGAEDFAIGFGINGIQGAIRGATNNMAQMGAIISPLVGTIVGFAGAGVAAIAVMVGMASRAKKAAEGIEELNTALVRQNKLLQRNLRFGFLREDILGPPGDLKAAQAALLKAERSVKSKGVELKGKQEQRELRIQQFGKEKIFGGLFQREREKIIDSILRQQGIDTGKLRETDLAKLESKRKTVRQDLSIGNVHAKFIEQAVKELGFRKVDAAFKEFTKKTADGVNIVTRAVQELQSQARILANDVKQLEKSPKEFARRTEERNKLAAKDAKEEEKRAAQKQKLLGGLLDVLDPTSGKLRAINERLEERRKQIISLKAPGTDFPIPGAERQKLLDDAERAATIERDKVLADRQKKIISAREKKVNAQKKVTDQFKKESASRLGFAKSFLPPDERRKIELEERIDVIRESKFLVGIQKTQATIRLLRLDALSQQRQDILGAPKQGASFAGVTEFAKQFQMSITKFQQKSTENKKLEEIGEKQSKILKEIKKAIKKQEATFK